MEGSGLREVVTLTDSSSRKTRMQFTDSIRLKHFIACMAAREKGLVQPGQRRQLQ